LQLGALALEVGLAGFGRAFELGLELEVELAAFGHELAADVIAFFGFA
jgi:hypothetical protein